MHIATSAIAISLLTSPALAQPASDTPDLTAVIASPRSELAPIVQRFDADRASLMRTYFAPASTARQERLDRFYGDWLTSLDSLAFDGLSHEAKVDFILLRSLVAHERRALQIDAQHLSEALPHAPFAHAIVELAESQRGGEGPTPEQAALRLDELKKQLDAAKKVFEEHLKPGEGGAPGISPTTSRRVLDLLEGLRNTLGDWYGFYNEYDPQFSWWAAKAYDGAADSFRSFITLVREKGVGITADNPNVIVGTPIGREALLSELEFEMIPYSPEEVLAIGERELAWCQAEMKKAAQDMGCGEDWKQALERVKEDHVQPGEQPALIRRLADEAVAFVQDKELITVPPLAAETWRMEMMSPQRQLVNPFFTGGEVISVSFPVASMTHEQKQMSLRGNNVHFARATVFHELIPGHHLQQYSEVRNNTHRAPFSTPFWTEGWALYWEMLLWDKGFTLTPEDRVGALLWRSHRCARIICSINFHLGKMTSQEWVEFLVDRVGHERANAEGEVRRSVAGGYGPLYQAAYMLGGLQFRALHRELVDSGKMTDKAFHNAVLREGNMPVEMVRALLTGQELSKYFTTRWRFDRPAHTPD